MKCGDMVALTAVSRNGGAKEYLRVSLYADYIPLNHNRIGTIKSHQIMIFICTKFYHYNNSKSANIYTDVYANVLVCDGRVGWLIYSCLSLL